jgi:transposase
MNKAQIIAEAQVLMEGGAALRKAAAQLSIPHSTLAVWLKKVKEEGDIETKAKKGGRPKVIEFTERELALAKWFRLAKESIDVAAYFFARNNEVRDELKQLIKKYEEHSLMTGKRINWPLSIRRAFAVTDQEQAAFRGKKASQQVEMITRRGMFEVMSDGSIADIMPGDTWELDDYSTNQPYYYKDNITGELNLGRQVLGARDLSAAWWLGFDHIGRERDSYRGEDILRFIERLVMCHGLPKRLRLERGRWDSSYIHGIEVDGLRSRWGDLRDLMQIEHVFKSKSKSIIEGGFNVLQRWLAHTGTDIGRFRGEFEEATKLYFTARKDGVNPADLGFLSQHESSLAHAEAAKIINSRPMDRAHLSERVAPDDLIARNGWHTKPLSQTDAWYFYPCKQQRIVRAGCVEVNPGGGWPQLTFTVNGIMEGVNLENGHKVLIACDPMHPNKGAYVCNADRGVKNRESYGIGEFLLTAPMLGLAPQFNDSGILTPHLVVRKKASAAATTAFRSIKNAAKGTDAKSEKSVTDGKGQVAHLGSIDRTKTKESSDSSDSETIQPTIQTPVRQNKQQPILSRFSRGGNTASEIKATGPWPALTMVHEVGHVLDHLAIGSPGSFASISEDILTPVLEKLKQTKAYLALSKNPRVDHSYLLNPKELWARAYAQYIAVRSGDARLLKDLKLVRNSILPDRQWTDEEFEPIAQEIDKAFEKLNWNPKNKND